MIFFNNCWYFIVFVKKIVRYYHKFKNIVILFLFFLTILLSLLIINIEKVRKSKIP